MGCIYFVKHKGLDPIKIGMSNYNNPFHRIGDMETASPFGIELLGFIKTNDPHRLEKKYHDKFRSLHIKGEWFSVPVEKIHSILDYHNDNKLVQQIAQIIEELDISPRDALNYITSAFTSLKKKTDFTQVYITLLPTADSGWVYKNKILNAYCKKYQCSIARAYAKFKEEEASFLSRKEGKKTFIKPKEME
tara:strand:- start:17454 stop:18026 length:573 start_codon:yes stop_codon:yes gene_type:complete